jgi:sugar lactone lactonase YvrE
MQSGKQPFGGGEVRDVRLVESGFTFLEGPRWYGDSLYVSDFYSHRVLIFKGGAGPARTVCIVDGQPSGLGLLPDGRLLVASMLDKRLYTIEDGSLAEYADISQEAEGPINDMIVDRLGRAYVGNFGRQLGEDSYAPTAVHMVTPNGTVDVAAQDLAFPNGMALTRDGTQLIVAETYASRLTSFEVARDGALGRRRTWATVTPRTAARAMPDGIAMDEQGAIWIGDCTGSGATRIVDGGDVTGYIDTGDMTVYAVALGGTEDRTLFMCAAPLDGTWDPVSTQQSVLLACDVEAPRAQEG